MGDQSWLYKSCVFLSEVLSLSIHVCRWVPLHSTPLPSKDTETRSLTIVSGVRLGGGGTRDGNNNYAVFPILTCVHARYEGLFILVSLITTCIDECIDALSLYPTSSKLGWLDVGQERSQLRIKN